MMSGLGGCGKPSGTASVGKLGRLRGETGKESIPALAG